MVRRDCIEVIEQVDDFRCRVTVNGTIYECNLPFSSLLSALELVQTPGVSLPGISPSGPSQYFAG